MIVDRMTANCMTPTRVLVHRSNGNSEETPGRKRGFRAGYVEGKVVVLDVFPTATLRTRAFSRE